MPSSCMRCNSLRVIDLETICKLGIATGALVGILKGAYGSLYSSERLIGSSTQFPLNRLAAAAVAAIAGGIAGAAAGHRLFQYVAPPDDGALLLCLECGYAFRMATD